jgi:hypothetical protein
MRTRTWIPIGVPLAVVALWACGGGEQSGSAADTTARNLTLAPAESTAALRDAPVATPEPPAPAPKPKPPAPTTISLPAGTGFELAANDTITTRSARVGDPFTAIVASDVRNRAGRVVIPAGSVARGTLTAVKAAPNPSSPGTLALSISTITIRGREYPVDLAVDSLETVRKGRGIEGADAARVGAGAAAGAIAGRVLGKDKKGTIIGGVVGGVAGAAVSAAVKDVDIVLPAGARIIVRLVESLTVRLS